MNLNREWVEDTDNQVWDAPEKEIHASCYLKPEKIEISLPKSPTAFIESDTVHNLGDME